MHRYPSGSAALAALAVFALAAGCGKASPAVSDAGGAAGASGGDMLAPFLGQWQRVSGTFSQVCGGVQQPPQAQTGPASLTVSAAASGSGADLDASMGSPINVGPCVALLGVNGATATLIPPGPACAGNIVIAATTSTYTTLTLTVAGAAMNFLGVSDIVYANTDGTTGHCVGTAMSSYARSAPDGSAGG